MLWGSEEQAANAWQKSKGVIGFWKTGPVHPWGSYLRLEQRASHCDVFPTNSFLNDWPLTEAILLPTEREELFEQVQKLDFSPSFTYTQHIQGKTLKFLIPVFLFFEKTFSLKFMLSAYILYRM